MAQNPFGMTDVQFKAILAALAAIESQLEAIRSVLEKML